MRILILLMLFSSAALADETCGDFIGAIKSGDINNIFYSYRAGIDDMGVLDAIEYKEQFQAASTDVKDINSMQMMMERAYLQCLKLAPSEPLDETIKATMRGQ